MRQPLHPLKRQPTSRELADFASRTDLRRLGRAQAVETGDDEEADDGLCHHRQVLLLYLGVRNVRAEGRSPPLALHHHPHHNLRHPRQGPAETRMHDQPALAAAADEFQVGPRHLQHGVVNLCRRQGRAEGSDLLQLGEPGAPLGPVPTALILRTMCIATCGGTSSGDSGLLRSLHGGCRGRTRSLCTLRRCAHSPGGVLLQRRRRRRKRQWRSGRARQWWQAEGPYCGTPSPLRLLPSVSPGWRWWQSHPGIWRRARHGTIAGGRTTV
mmetsp:Transcript_38082/g.109871  ORF Transcript_38082/g.109871 Transcript_38082/m.109871 type:complete len:269 (+) Transcript_38082:732-1538(+)